MPLQKGQDDSIHKKKVPKDRAHLDELTAHVGRNPVCILQEKWFTLYIGGV
ncbi:hypothetical protein RCO48_02855 [Peribacillus frigoritolerans]|nr:hypothetical protein [Peribacillus frigoritolerans]